MFGAARWDHADELTLRVRERAQVACVAGADLNRECGFWSCNPNRAHRAKNARAVERRASCTFGGVGPAADGATIHSTIGFMVIAETVRDPRAGMYLANDRRNLTYESSTTSVVTQPAAACARISATTRSTAVGTGIPPGAAKPSRR